MIHLISRKGVTVKKIDKREQNMFCKDIRKKKKDSSASGTQSPFTPTLLLQAWQTGPEEQHKVTQMSRLGTRKIVLPVT
jgi:hypothetical protein